MKKKNKTVDNSTKVEKMEMNVQMNNNLNVQMEVQLEIVVRGTLCATSSCHTERGFDYVAFGVSGWKKIELMTWSEYRKIHGDDSKYEKYVEECVFWKNSVKTKTGKNLDEVLKYFDEDKLKYQYTIS